MGKKWRDCKCGSKRKRPFKPLQPNELDCKNVDDIITALTIENLLPELRRKAVSQPKYFKMKPFRPPQFRGTCVPMAPPMDIRLRYIGHCPVQPPREDEKFKRTLAKYDFVSTSDEGKKGIIKKRRPSLNKKKVRYSDRTAGNVLSLPTPVPFVKHTDSDKSILRVPSPKTSGEIVEARRASIKPAEIRPPLPPKSGYELFKPHSGIIINEGPDYVPDINVMNISGMDGHKKGKHGLCSMKTCKNKRCRRYRAMLKRKANKRAGKTSGKSRAKGAYKQVHDDDSVCGLDEIPKPEHVQLPLNVKRGALETHSLTVIPCNRQQKYDIHYGILTGNYNMYDTKFSGKSRGRQALAMSVMSYCLAFHYHPKQWTMKLVDNLVDAGDTWYLQCLEKVHDHSSVQGICEVLPFGKKQILLLNGKKMQVLLGEPDIVGYTMSTDPTVYNLCRGLKAFFKENRAGVMMSRILKVIIWKDKVCYYIFDPAGRDSRGYSNFDIGRAALMNVKDLDSVSEFLLARSVLEDQKFVLAPVKVLKMIDEKADIDLESDKELTQAEKAMMSYRILNENCAIVNANMHLGDRCFEDAKFRQAIPIAVVAMTYAKISPPNTWFSKTLNKILRLGNKLYVQCAHPKVLIDLTIDNIPNEITIGPYACEIIIYRERVKGQLFAPKDCFLNIRTGLQEFFSQGYSSGIVEFNNYALAIWKQKEMYYLFDPYPRTIDGLRTIATGKACCIMGLNPETLANIIIQNFDYLPPTAQFCIHAFKVLKLKKRQRKAQIVCTLSDDELTSMKGQRKVLPESQAHGDGSEKTVEIFKHAMPADGTVGTKSKIKSGIDDEEKMGDIVSLVDSIQEDYLPPIPLRFKGQVEKVQPKLADLDSPTVSVTQIVPPWPKPRDKTNEPPEPDPDPEPTPPPTPPPVLPPEGGVEEEEAVEEEEDEETAKAKKEERERKKAEEEEARRKAEELPPPVPPPPPSPQPEPEVPLLSPVQIIEEEIEAPPPVNVDRRILLTEDAQKRFKLRQIRNKMTAPLAEEHYETPYEKELAQPHNFKDLPDFTQIIRGSQTLSQVGDKNALDILPFGAIMAIVTSYKYSINTWNPSIVDFVVDTAKKLHSSKQQKFQLSPVHIIPKIAIGQQAFHANIDVVGEGASWQLEDILDQKFFDRYDRGMVTTATYSCAIFKKNGLYYLFDGSPCNAMGLRDENKDSKGKACFLRFRNVHDLAARIAYNKDGKTEDQQFILSRILVRRLLKEPRLQLPEDYDYATRRPESAKSKTTIVPEDKEKTKQDSVIEDTATVAPLTVGYQRVGGLYRIEGTTSLNDRKATSEIKACHFVSLMAMLMATMHPIRTWNAVMIDTCIEKGLEIFEKATNKSICEKRVIKNVILEGKFININIKKIMVVNENPEKHLDQFLRAVLRRLRYVIIRFPQCSLVICHTSGYYHLFDPYPPPNEPPSELKTDDKNPPPIKASPVATWTLYPSIDALVKRIRKIVSSKDSENPEFYTFELTSVKTAPRHSALNYRLSPLFRPDENPNAPYLRRRKIRPTVDEKMYWLNIPMIPWSRLSCTNDLGFERKIPKTLWKNWDIEFPGDLYSLWGTIHPTDKRFNEAHRGKQYLATSVLAIGMTQACDLSAWTSGFLDGIVVGGDNYHKLYMDKISGEDNHEVEIEKLDTTFDNMYPFSFGFKFEKVIFGFVYNIYDDRFNLSKALTFFFESHKLGVLISLTKNLSFGKIGPSYFMFDCQSNGAPIFSPGHGSAYILKCESLNRLIYCMTITLNIKTHGQQFDLYSVEVTVNEKSN